MTAFLLAQLDLRLDTDAATARATELFRSRDPLLGSVAASMEQLRQLEVARGQQLAQLQQELHEVRHTAEVVEQVVSYSIADRYENFMRGSHRLDDVPLGHKAAVTVRDMAREATAKQRRIEQDRDGRPIR